MPVSTCELVCEKQKSRSRQGRSAYRKRSVTVKSAGGKGHFILRGGQSLARNEVCTGPHICKEEELDSKREQ